MMHTSIDSAAGRAARYAALLGLMRAGANFGDHITQSGRDAVLKAATDAAPVTYKGEQYGTRAGRAACLRHSLTYTATQAAVIGVGARALGVRLPAGRLLAALAVTGASHYLIDRREPLRRACDAIGKGEFYRHNSGGINGSYLMDQAVHHLIEAVACLIPAAD
ncbi:hypothetical protein ACFWA9_10140 [Kitasatospora sp. NPDC059973]|uniref:hypothetical protein n=1 Tax=Kitasatospora sp. NPDC059973 TaxID=3347020 RepID=UPI00368B17D3